MRSLEIIPFFKKYRKFGYLFIIPGLIYLAKRISILFLEMSKIEQSKDIEIIMFIASCFLVLLIYLVFIKLFVLIIERKKNIIGAMIKTRLTVSFFLVTIVPVLIFFILIAFLIDTGVKAVYQRKVEKALELSIDNIKKDRNQVKKDFLINSREYLLKNFGNYNYSNVVFKKMKFDHIGRTSLNLVPKKIKKIKTLLLKESKNKKISFSEINNRMAFIYFKKNNNLVEYAVKYISESFNKNANIISSALSDYRQIRLIKKPMRIALLYIVLFIVIIIALLVILVAIKLAKNISEPINALAKATRQVALGDLTYRVENIGNDELRMLVDHFNKMTDELLNSQQRLHHAERIAAWQEVAKRLAHEIKNPLTPIKLSAERVLRRATKGSDDLNQVVSKSLPSIITEVDTIRDLVDEFASFARLPEKIIKKINLNKFIEEIISFFKQDNESIKFEFISSDNEIILDFDPKQIRRAIGNLIKNSLNALKLKEKNKEISLKIKNKKDKIIISISDNGKGISDNIKADVFNPYFSATRGGTGLGLAIVEKIIIDHDGKIWFESQEGTGTVFYIELPIKRG